MIVFDWLIDWLNSYRTAYKQSKKTSHFAFYDTKLTKFIYRESSIANRVESSLMVQPMLKVKHERSRFDRRF